MLGSALGNVVGTLYFLLYQFAGVLIAFTVFKRENRWFKVLFGSVMGSFLIHWLPTLTAFLMNFTLAAHISALMLLVLILVAVLYFDKRFFSKNGEVSQNNILSGKDGNSEKTNLWQRIIKTIKEKPVLAVFVVLYCYTVKVWSHHVLTF